MFTTYDISLFVETLILLCIQTYIGYKYCEDKWISKYALRRCSHSSWTQGANNEQNLSSYCNCWDWASASHIWAFKVAYIWMQQSSLFWIWMCLSWTFSCRNLRDHELHYFPVESFTAIRSSPYGFTDWIFKSLANTFFEFSKTTKLTFST